MLTYVLKSFICILIILIKVKEDGKNVYCHPQQHQ